MNKELNDMILSFLNYEYDIDKFCYDYSDKYFQINIKSLENKYIQIYDNINEVCSLYDDTKTYDKRLLNEKQFRDKVKYYYQKLI